MRHTTFEQKLQKKLEENLPGAAPGVMVQVFQNGKKVGDVATGETYAYYDLASLTKIIFTTQAMTLAFQAGKWNLKTRVQEILRWYPHDHITLVQLLNHSAGLEWWYPLFQELDLKSSVEHRRGQLKEFLRTSPLRPSEVSVYSDLGFWLLGFVLEELYELPLKEVWQKTKETCFPRLSMDFSENNESKHPVRYYAPTEKCPWRARVLQGEVHDENCWAMGGISTHAGLFGSIDDVGWFGLYVRSQLAGMSKTIIKQKTAQLFATRSRPIGGGDFALGYMMPTPGKSSTGDYFSPYSIGHTGFTGTSFWFDPTQDLVVVILSNRIAFGRDLDDFKLLRPKIHNWIVEGLRRS